MKTIRWGMIGCGAVTEIKSGPGLYKANYSELKAVFSRRYEMAKDYAKRHGVNKVYETVEELLADQEIDAVYIATPPKSHKEYALLCLEAGKVPFIEKPMALDYKECETILNKAEEVGLPVYVAYYRRAMEKFIKIKELIEKEEIGKLRYVGLRHLMCPLEGDLDKENMHWMMRMEETLGGRFIDVGTHMLDILDFLIGKIEKIEGFACNTGNLYDVEDTVTATFTFENGVIGTGTWCYVENENLDEVEIVGEKGRIKFSVMNYEPITVIKGKEKTMYAFEQPMHVTLSLIQSIVDEMLELGKCPGDAKRAAHTVGLTDHILKSYRAANGRVNEKL